MNARMRQALFEMYDLMDEAAAEQAKRGVIDQGKRSNMTSGKHLNKVLGVIVDDLLKGGYPEQDVIYEGRQATIPGWFRPTKCWDLLALYDGDLIGAIELKSINSSFSNNANNRAEEALGSVRDAEFAIRYGRVSARTMPPAFGYALIVLDCDDSRKRPRLQKSVYSADEVFKGASYLERLTITARRLLAERVYQAVWVACVNVEKATVIEPDPDLCYESFIETFVSRRRIMEQGTGRP